MAEEKFVSGEEHQKIRQSKTDKSKQVTVNTRSLMVAAGVVILCVISFSLGMSYQKHHTATSLTTTNSFANGGSGAFAGGHRSGGFGQVTAVSATSITIMSQRTSTNATYTINSSTTITDNGQTVAASDIQNGDTVIIRTSGTGSTTATNILVNPSFGGAPGGAGGTSSGSATSGSATPGFN